MERNLLQIKAALAHHRRDRRELEPYYVQARLNKSLVSYYKQLEASVEYLCNRKPENVVKEIK